MASGRALFSCAPPHHALACSYVGTSETSVDKVLVAMSQPGNAYHTVSQASLTLSSGALVAQLGG